MTDVVELVVIVRRVVPVRQDSASIRVPQIAQGRSVGMMGVVEPAGIAETPRNVPTGNAFVSPIAWASFAETTAVVAPAVTVPSPCPA